MPKPRTLQLSESQGRWIIGGTKSNERKLLERMVEYLHIDPSRDGDPLVLRFVLKNRKPMQNAKYPSYDQYNGERQANFVEYKNHIPALHGFNGSYINASTKVGVLE
jgi:hypothetical protein